MPREKTITLYLQRFLAASFAALLVLALGMPSAEAARKKKNNYRQPDRYAAIVIEAATGYVISEKNADKALYPASLTKMMTLYLAFEAMTQGKLNRSQYIPVSRKAAAQEPSSLGLKAGDYIRVEDAILGIATKSANDCAVALAEAVGGSESAFARAMTVKARQLGMRNTNFVNASGLHNKRQFSTARDMATLSRALIRDYPRYYRYFSASSFTYREHTYINHNRLMGSYPGMDGLKTGYVYASGFNLAASAVRDGTRLIGVVFGGKTARSRNKAMAGLLDEGFSRIGGIRVAALNGNAQGTALPVRRPESPPAYPPETAGGEVAYSAGGASTDQGDADIGEEAAAETRAATPPQIAAIGAAKGGWAIQVGAFASRDASLQALKKARTALGGAAGGIEAVSPLMTSRGMIYRAKFIGLDRAGAEGACRILRNNCLVMTAE